jgi:membrane-associated phospholipid phosphatase
MENKEKLLLIQIIILVILAILIPVILLISSLFEFTWNQALRDLLPGSEYFFRIITEFGGTYVYYAILFTVFWAISKNAARSLFIVYVSSNFVNWYAKTLIANERPPESEWILIGASHLSTPSGHAMSSTVFWGFSAMKVKRWLMWIITISIIILIGLSRMYLGVHWFGDILTGWLFGIIILLLVWIFEEPLRSYISKYNIITIYLGLALFGFVVMIFTEIFLTQEYNFGTPGGQMIGLGIGFALEHKYVNFGIAPESKSKLRIFLRVLIGLIIILVVFLILDLIIPSEIFWLVAIEQIVIFLVGIVIWPLIFKKIGI